MRVKARIDAFRPDRRATTRDTICARAIIAIAIRLVSESAAMGIKNGQAFCKRCNKHVLGVKQTPNHILHLLLSLVTMGAWIVIWVLVSIRIFDRYSCTQCGAKARAV